LPAADCHHRPVCAAGLLISAALRLRSVPMMSSRLAAALARRRVHYGWMIAGVPFLPMLVTAGAVGAPGVLILPLQKEFGWQNAEISSALGIRFLLFGLMAPFAAALINRFGMRRI